MAILVTGASGHVGTNLVKILSARGHQLRALVHDNMLPPYGLNVEVVRGDICDFNSILRACESIEVVYHLAARISIGADNWVTLEKVNVTGTRNVVEACLTRGVKRLVHFSSIHAIVQKPFEIPVDESRPLVKLKHNTGYDRSKAAGEEEVYKGIARGLDAIIISPTAIIGPYDYRSSYFGEALLAMAKGKLPALISGGFDWVDVRDVAEGAIRAEENAPHGSKYLLSGHWASVKDMAVMVSEITGVPCPRLVCPGWLASGLAPVAENLARLTNQRQLFTKDSMRALRTCNRRISHEKATRELGYNPRPLQETMEDTLRWYTENGKLKRVSQVDGIQK